jgi:hypothetical protein
VRVPLSLGSDHSRIKEAESRRCINMLPAIQDSDTAKSPMIASQIPGLSLFCDPGFGEIRGAVETGRAAYFTAGNRIITVDANGGFVSRGTILTSAGPVSMDKNRFQVIAVDGRNGYVVAISNGDFAQIASPAFTAFGSKLVAVSKGTAVFTRPGTDVFYTSEIDDALTINPTKFATAESSPDEIVGHMVDHEKLILFGTEGTEIQDNSGGADFVFTKNEGASIQQGAVSAYCMARLDNTVFWVGRSKEGHGVVYRMSGYNAQRVSNESTEQALQAPGVDLSTTRCFSIQHEGHQLFFVNADGMETTRVFDAKGGRWHEWAEFVNGEYRPFRATCHLFAYGKHLIGGSDGKIYYLDYTKNTFNGDVMCREIISPHRFGPNGEKIKVNGFELECDTGVGLPSGQAGQVMFKYSRNKGKSWSDWRYGGLGVVGDARARPKIHRLGEGRGWVVRARVTDDVPFNVVGVNWS